VIPDDGAMKINVRTFDDAVRTRVLAAIERIVADALRNTYRRAESQLPRRLDGPAVELAYRSAHPMEDEL